MNIFPATSPQSEKNILLYNAKQISREIEFMGTEYLWSKGSNKLSREENDQEIKQTHFQVNGNNSKGKSATTVELDYKFR